MFREHAHLRHIVISAFQTVHYRHGNSSFRVGVRGKGRKITASILSPDCLERKGLRVRKNMAEEGRREWVLTKDVALHLLQLRNKVIF